MLRGIEQAAGWLLNVTSEILGMFAKPSVLSKSVVLCACVKEKNATVIFVGFFFLLAYMFKKIG